MAALAAVGNRAKLPNLGNERPRRRDGLLFRHARYSPRARANKLKLCPPTQTKSHAEAHVGIRDSYNGSEVSDTSAGSM